MTWNSNPLQPPTTGSFLRIWGIAAAIALLVFTNSWGQEPQTAGSLVICGGGALPEVVFQRFAELGKGRAGRLVVVPTASSRASNSEEALKATRERWVDRGFSADRILTLHTTDRKLADSAAFVAPLRQATAIWFDGGQQQRLADIYVGTEFAKELHAFLQRGGVIGGTSAGAAIQSQVMIASGRKQPVISTGLDLLPNAIIDQHFLQRNRLQRLLAAVTKHPGRVGYGISEGTALIYHKGALKVMGKSFVMRIHYSPTAAIDDRPGEPLTPSLRLDIYNATDEIPLP